jgi:hypothetical protein
MRSSPPPVQTAKHCQSRPNAAILFKAARRGDRLNRSAADSNGSRNWTCENFSLARRRIDSVNMNRRSRTKSRFWRGLGAVVLVAFIQATGVAGLRADERVTGLFLRALVTDDSDPAAKLYGLWSNIVLLQVQNELTHALEDLTADDQGRYLKNFDIVTQKVPKIPAQNEFEAMWEKPNILLLIEGIPQNPSPKNFIMNGTAFLGPKIGSLNKKWKDGIKLTEVMQVDASRASADALVLIILYSLIENAIFDKKGDQVVCALIAEAHNFVHKAEFDPGVDSSVTENTEEFAAGIAARLDLHTRERSCLHAR